MNLNLNQADNNLAEEMGFAKPTKGRKSAVNMGAKHTVKTIANRSVKDTLGNGIVGSIAALLVRTMINKQMK